MRGCLVLENGQKFYGQLLMDDPAVGEVVFNTGMTGYEETFTDPSYAGQIITMTYPLIGNYGTLKDIQQADRPYAAGFILSELCDRPSNWQNEGTLASFIMTHRIPCLYGVDTRAITRAIRSHGVMKGVIVPEYMADADVQSLLATPLETLLVKQVTPKSVRKMGDGRFHVAVMDFGAKANILKSLVKNDCRLTVFPAYTKAEEVLAVNPDGIFLSNGPGDPQDLPEVIAEVKKLIGKKPIFGICLGHQLLGLSVGAKSRKLAFGHRGANHPVKDVKTGRVYITSQNHGYVIDEATLPSDAIVTHVNLHDNTLEGFAYPKYNFFCVQYHPEASPGPTDNLYLFEQFVSMMEGK
ncbi:carbamoyl phosphate synthase small subunit [uncultured Megasphaera sp.]|uniref:carbamoyl phosphate synthase small subunit n=1 Tax=uncultured Megasphaera sp. TaxID=165188 RepID=UPI0025979246|nr:carbamoyl phosphate synthase small subunit [uncultured Megasphaera sp.]